MKHSTIPLSQTVVQLCKAKGIEHIVISPGSRNAPLTIGFTHDDFFTCYSIVDERSAAFFALGIAQNIQKPVAVVCTSGSALLNYYPAVSEAFYSDIPLVVLSADRPEYLVGVGDGQTINQKNVFANHIVYSANLKQDSLDKQESIQKENESEINNALNLSIEKRGPVHINVPFDEPLYNMTDVLTVNVSNQPTKPFPTTTEDFNALADIWNKAKRKMVLVGVNQPNAVEQKYLDALAEDNSVLVLTETTSNLHHELFFPSIDKLIAPLDEAGFKALKPEILLTFGGMVVSKKIKAFLRQYKPKHHWHVDFKKANNTFFCLTEHLKMDVNVFFKAFLSQTHPINSDYRDFWLGVMQVRRKKHEDYLNDIPFSDFKAFDFVLKSIPNNANLQVGNSSAIRYVQLFDVNKTLKVFCNRGTSGIDGSTSTAIGYAQIAKEQTVFITGDLSFFYDSNALWNNYIPKSFRIIVINNRGGGIFRILPGHKNTPNFDKFFETQHHLTADHLCHMFGFDYLSANDENQLNQQLQNFYKESDHPKLLEIFTPRTLNDQLLLDYFEYIK